MIPICAVVPAIRARANCSRTARRSSRCTRSSKRRGHLAAIPTSEICQPTFAPRDGVVEAIDCLRLNRLARTAGAPIDKGAGIKVFKKIGDRVEQGEPLYRIHAYDASRNSTLR